MRAIQLKYEYILLRLAILWLLLVRHWAVAGQRTTQIAIAGATILKLLHLMRDFLKLPDWRTGGSRLGLALPNNDFCISSIESDTKKMDFFSLCCTYGFTNTVLPLASALALASTA